MLTKRSLDYLRDLFTGVTGKVNGYEHVLARRPKEFRLKPPGKLFPHKSGCGPKESARRRRQMARQGLTTIHEEGRD